MPEKWSTSELREIVRDYFEMLRLVIEGRPINKAALLRSLQPKLASRSRGSIEFKRENISAAMLDLRLPPVPGYKPKWNYQRDILPAICEVFQRHPEYQSMIEADVSRGVSPPEVTDILKCLQNPPSSATLPDEPPEPPEDWKNPNRWDS
ncbi:MAG: hypothetical protein HY049_18220, partial [Acidobacteria bacterium]|nr:hypothetical protein [Acidobacteriota bacterium]